MQAGQFVGAALLQRLHVAGFLRRLLGHPAFINGEIHTGFLDAHPEIAAEPKLPEAKLNQLLAVAAMHTRAMRVVADTVPNLHAAIGAWRN